jgi:hypothetical protein
MYEVWVFAFSEPLSVPIFGLSHFWARCDLTFTSSAHSVCGVSSKLSCVGCRLNYLHNKVKTTLGRAIAQAVSRQLPTVVVQVRSQVKWCWVCGGQNGTGAGFLRVLRFPLPIPYSSLIRSWYNRPFSGLSVTSPDETKKEKVMQSGNCKKQFVNLAPQVW